VTYTTYIHIGHGKTGTSAIQSALALAKHDLRLRGIIYPVNEYTEKKAVEFKITSGNWVPDISLPEQLREAKQHYGSSFNSVVFSSEQLFWKINQISEIPINQRREINPHIILAVREIEEMLSAEHQQKVKRGGECCTFDEFISKVNFKSSHHTHAASVIDDAKKSGIKISIINYSTERRSIINKIFEIIGANEAVPAELHTKIVNRSLSRHELSLICSINQFFNKKIGTGTSDALVQELPQIAGNKGTLALEAKQLIYEVNKQSLAAINSNLPIGSMLRTSPEQQSEATSLSTPETYMHEETEHQSTALAIKTLSSILPRFTPPKLSAESIDIIRDVALKDGLPTELRIELLKLTIFYRPNASRLKKILKQTINNLSSGKSRRAI